VNKSDVSTALPSTVVTAVVEVVVALVVDSPDAGWLMLTAADEAAPETDGEVVAALAQPVNAPAARAALMMRDIQSRYMVLPSFRTLLRILQAVPEPFLKRCVLWGWVRWREATLEVIFARAEVSRQKSLNLAPLSRQRT